MLIAADVRVPFPCSLVYAAYRDHLATIAPALTNIRSVELLSRQPQPQGFHCVYVWQGGGDIPKAIKGFLSEEMLAWTEFNTWNDAHLTLDWRIQTHAFSQAVHCVGCNRFIEDNQMTLIQSRGELAIDPAQLEGVPRFLSGTVARLVEEFLAKKIEPNLYDLGDGIRQYLEGKALANPLVA